MSDVLEIVCDDPRHVRGKMTTWAFQRGGDGWSPLLPSESGKRKYFSPVGGYSGNDSAGRYRFACNLCPSSLECGEDDTLQWLLDTVWARRDELIACGLLKVGGTDGVSVVSLKTASLIASNRPKSR